MLAKKYSTIKRLIALVLLMLPTLCGFAQLKFYNRLVFDIEPRFGFVMPHHEHIGYFLNKNIAGIQANIAISADGSKDWHQRFNYPLIGLGYFHSGLGNDEIYGKLNGYYAFVDYNFFEPQSRWNVANRISFGIGHNTKCFDLKANPRNIVVATHINAFFQYDLALHYFLTPQTSIRLSGGLTHSSNGNLREPNSGFNTLTFSVGLQHYLKDFKTFKIEKPYISTDSTKVAMLIGGFFGAKTYSIENNSLYPSYGILAEFQYRIIPSGIIGVELSAYRDEAMKLDFYDEKGENARFKSINYYRFTLNPTYLVQMGRIYVAIQPGIYLNFKFLPRGICSHKLGLRYQVNNNLLASIAVKTHYFANSDFIELSLRYKFNIK